MPIGSRGRVSTSSFIFSLTQKKMEGTEGENYGRFEGEEKIEKIETIMKAVNDLKELLARHPRQKLGHLRTYRVVHKEMVYTFIHPTKTGGTAVERFFRDHFTQKIKGDGHNNLCTNDNNSIIIIRDPVERFLSMYFYWKNGAIDTEFKRSEEFKKEHENVDIKKFISFIKNNDTEKLHHTFTWNKHFFPQVKWINDVNLKNLIIIKYKNNLNQSIQNLLKYLEIDNKKLTLPKINITNKNDENVILDDLDLQFIHQHYIKDFILIDKINLYPEMFKKVIS